MFLIIFITIFNSCNIYVNAMNNPLDDPGAYKPSPLGEEKQLTAMAGVILGTINTIGIVISVIVLMVMGIKYITGSVEEKAEYKKMMLPYLIGALLLFSATTIPNLIYNWMNQKVKKVLY